MLQYDYTWGDEDVLGYRVTVIRESNEGNYLITLEQEGVDPTKFSDIEISSIAELINRQTRENEWKGITIRWIELKVKAKNNPPPETLFKIIPAK